MPNYGIDQNLKVLAFIVSEKMAKSSALDKNLLDCAYLEINLSRSEVQKICTLKNLQKKIAHLTPPLPQYQIVAA